MSSIPEICSKLGIDINRIAKENPESFDIPIDKVQAYG